MNTLVNRDDPSSFPIPSNWRQPSLNTSVNESVALSRGVVGTLIPLFNASSGLVQGLDGGVQTALLLNAISLLDYKAGSATYRGVVTQNINAATAEFNVTPDQSSVAYPIEWGLAAVRAYRAYNDTTMLTIGKGIWDQMSRYSVTADNAAQGVHPLKTPSIMGECGGTTTAGAIFLDSQDTNKTEANTEATGAFSALSGLLFEATQEPQYHEAAELSTEFIKNHLWDGQIIRDSFDLHSCSDANEFKLCYNTGKMFEATSILATGNETWNSFLAYLVASATPFANWTGSDGVNTEGPTSINAGGLSSSSKAFFIRGLYETWERTSDAAMANYIEAYLSVQFNALQVTASSPGTDHYSPNWGVRPPASPLLPEGQLTALDVLSSQVGFARRREATAQNGSSTAPVSPTMSATPPSETKHTKSIIGAAVGGTGVILLISVALWCFLRMRRRPRGSPSSPKGKSHTSSGATGPEGLHPSVVPYDILEHPVARGLIPPKGSGQLAECGDRSSNNVFRRSEFPVPVAPFARSDAESLVDSQGSIPEERRSYDSGTRERAAVMTSGPTSPALVELLQAIVARYPPESGRRAPPSYYTN